ncbi:uncharacterized protein L201_004310 [Kwoniella dendrophila CBS 6074]|uniref:Uncharacterized protein n=1 Tax=Kwoniella dendrophila CBS 6074 TaxID=1295534 RepID=A0AAX4JVM5_9TREE
MLPTQPSLHSVDPDPDEIQRRREAIGRRIKFHREMERLHPRPEPPINWDEIKEFIRGLAVLLGAPIIIPMRLIHHALTSPLTISLVLKLMLLGLLFLASSIFSILAVGAFFWSWKIGGNIEVEGWLYYGSKNHRPPHTTVYFPLERIEHDLRYDVQVELELVRPTKGTTDEMGNFMLSLELKALSQPERTLITAAQPSLPPPALAAPFLSIPILPTSYTPCIIPYPFRSLCPSRLLGYSVPTAKIRERRAKGGFSSRERGKDVVPLKKDLMEGVIIKPAKNQAMTIGSGFVSIGREDLFEEKAEDGAKCKPPSREVKTTGWVLIRLIPRPTGIRWILSSHPLPPLLLLPPISLSLTFSSSILAFTIITLLRSGKGKSQPDEKDQARLDDDRPRVDGQTGQIDEVREGERRKKEWEEMQSSSGHGIIRKRSLKRNSFSGTDGASAIGGSTTTAPSASTESFGPTLMTRTISTGSSSQSSSTSPSTSDSAETVTPTRIRDRGQSQIVGGSGSSGSSGSGGSGSGSGSGSSGGNKNLRRRISGSASGNRRTSTTSTTTAQSADTTRGIEAEGSDTEKENNDGHQAEDEEETETEGGQEIEEETNDWREFGREFGLNT